MTDRSNFLIYARRIHNALRHAIEDGDGREDAKWIVDERPLFEHAACGMYLIGCLAYLEGKYGKKSWDSSSVSQLGFDSYVVDLTRKNIYNAGVSKNGLDALVCIRDALTHNENDLSKNRNSASFGIVSSAAIPGVALSGTVAALSSNDKTDFMSYVRLSLVAVAMYHGDG